LEGIKTMIHIFKTAVYPGAGAAKFAVVFLTIVSVFWAVSPLVANVEQDTNGVITPEKLEKEAADLVIQKRFLEASAKYDEAASTMLKDPHQAQDRATKYRAQSRYWFGFHFIMNAEEAFAQAAYERKGIAAVMERGNTIYERSRILTEVTTTHSMWMGMGRWFVLFFLIALASLASVKWFLNVNFSPSMMISTSLFVGLVGGFTRYAHQFLSYIPK